MTLSKVGSTFGKALGNVVSASATWTSNSSSTSFSWLKTCVTNPKKCSMSSADAGVDGGGGPTQDAGGDAGAPEAGMGECGQQQVSGADTPQTLVYDVRTPCGELTVNYNMNSLPDRLIVRYDGAEVANTGCVSGTGTLQVEFCGQSSAELTVQVEPNCNQTTGTAWDFTLNCPAK